MNNRSPVLADLDVLELLRLTANALANKIRDDRAHSCLTLDPCCSTCEAILVLRAADAELGTNRNSITGMANREARIARAS